MRVSHRNTQYYIKSYKTYFKGNYNLSLERIASFTQVSSHLNVVVKPGFAFKGKGTQIQLNPSKGFKYQWTPKGHIDLYKQMLGTFANLPNCYHIFTTKKYMFLHKKYNIMFWMIRVFT